MPPDTDGSTLLTTDEVADVLSAAVTHAGGALVEWRLDQVDTSPRRSTTATYVATVDWPSGRRTELLGASARAGGRSGNDERAVIVGDGDREVAVWVYPDDPDLPGLRRAAVPSELATVLTTQGILADPVRGEDLTIEMISYRPRRRAVVKAVINPGMTSTGTTSTGMITTGPSTTGQGPETFYIKVLRERSFGPTLERHEILTRAGIPAPVVAGATADFLMVLRPMVGRPLAHAIFDEAIPCSAENMISILDAMPPQVVALPRRPPWTDAVSVYAEMIIASLPDLRSQLRWLVGEIQTGLAGLPLGVEATHGDFHEGQIFVSGGMITGLGDVDTIGPGRRADDLACMVAHLSTVQRMSAEQAAGLTRLINIWMRVFDGRVDPRELRLRAAAVIISLATGPYRAQDADWQPETRRMVTAAVALVRSAAR